MVPVPARQGSGLSRISFSDLALDTLGDEETALFLMMSDTDGSFNFLIGMIYTQLFNLLCEKEDDVYGGRLPVHVRCLVDEAANIGQIPKLEKLVATIRSRPWETFVISPRKIHGNQFGKGAWMKFPVELHRMFL